MADFVQATNVKSAVRELSTPIADVTAFNTLVQSVITGNPFGCVGYIMAGVNHNPVEKLREYYTVRYVFENEAAETTGYLNERYDTITGMNAGVAIIMAHARLATAHNGTIIHDAAEDSYTVTLKCHDPNGELYYVTFSRDQVTVSSYTDDAIVPAVDTWADTIPALA